MKSAFRLLGRSLFQALAALLISASAHGAELTKLTASDASANDQFGIALAQDDDLIAVGAWRDDTAVLAAGSVYIFQRNPGASPSWIQVRKISANDGAASDNFGNAVALSGDTLAVGAVGDDDAGSESGAVYILQQNQGGPNIWGQVKKITAADALTGDKFGASVSLSGDWLVVGAPGADPHGEESGAAYLFYRDAGGTGNWGQVKKPTGGIGTALSQFGRSVGISGNTAIVGAWRNSDEAPAAGAAYIFERNQGGTDQWGLSALLHPTNPAPGDHFGVAVDIDAGVAVVGASQEETSGGPGVAYLYYRDQGGPGDWGAVRKVQASPNRPGAQFGRAVALSGGTLVVGAPLDAHGGLDAGTAYVFEQHEGGPDQWGQVQELNATDNSAGYGLGSSIALAGDFVIVGAPGSTQAVPDAGAAYILYSLAPRPVLSISLQDHAVTISRVPPTPGYTLEQTPSLSSPAWKNADTIPTPALNRFFRLRGSPPVLIDFVPVGNPGNANDSSGFGQVDSSFQIGRGEVSNEQYARFLNAVAEMDSFGLYNPAMASDPRAGIVQSGSPGSSLYYVKPNMGDKPVNYVSFFDALRFVNWLHHGQPAGAPGPSTTEDGAYTFTGPTSVGPRNAGAKVWLPNEDEWYKAAYHDPSKGLSGGYWLNPTRSDTSPTPALADAAGSIANLPGPVANYDSSANWNGLDGNVTTIDSAGDASRSFYGAADMAGNLWEWNEASQGALRGLRGGSWLDFDSTLESSNRGLEQPTREDNTVGFRVARP